jgi:hypothetical protein
MKFQISTCLCLLLGTLAQAAQRQILVSYPESTPQHILDQAIDVVKEAGGTILHEYTLIKGFAVSAALWNPIRIENNELTTSRQAKVSSEALESVRTLGYNPTIEDDSAVSIGSSA